jgi:hypothetical protein
MNLFALDWVNLELCNFRNSGDDWFTCWFIVQRYFIDIVRWSCFIDVLGVGQTKIKDGL